jgi:hypothetical protein
MENGHLIRLFLEVFEAKNLKSQFTISKLKVKTVIKKVMKKMEKHDMICALERIIV